MISPLFFNLVCYDKQLLRQNMKGFTIIVGKISVNPGEMF